MRKLFLRRRDFTVATLLFLLAAPATHAANETDVSAPIQRLIDGLLQIMKLGHGAPIQQRFGLLAPIIDRTFDLNTILEASVGPSWENLPADQQAMLVDAFRRYTVASYVNSFDEYNGQRFEISPQARDVGEDQVIQTKIIPLKGDSHELDYVMRRGSSGWRIVDVLAEGSISRVAVQRSDFRRLLTRGGAQALADSLRNKAADMTEGVG